MKISIITATAENNIIGNNGKIPWQSKEDLKHFKEITTGHHIVMGKKTFESIGKALPNRTNIIISRDTKFKVDGVTVFPDLDEAIRFAKDRKEEELFIIGGQQIYELALPITEKIYQTLVLEKYPGDTYFPLLSEAEWKEVSREEHTDLNPPLIFRVLERVRF